MTLPVTRAASRGPRCGVSAFDMGEVAKRGLCVAGDTDTDATNDAELRRLSEKCEISANCESRSAESRYDCATSTGTLFLGDDEEGEEEEEKAEGTVAVM